MSAQFFASTSRCAAGAVWSLSVLAIAVLVSGCGGGEGKEGLVRAYGTVTFDGEPLVDAQVSFDHPNYPETFGRTDAKGYYEMSYTASQRGAFAGENVVSFTTADPDQGREERVPLHYRFGQSSIKVDVTDGGSPYDFSLSSTEDVSATLSR